MADEVMADECSSSDRGGDDSGSGANLSGEKRKRTGGGKRGIVEFNAEGHPIGSNKSAYADYIGVLARTMIPLTDNDWRDTSEELKQRIWEELEQCFDVDNSRRAMAMKKVGKAARSFRSTMSKCCFDDEGTPILTPPPAYATNKVVVSSWLDFVEAVGSERFKELSQSNSKCAKSKRYLYRLGPLGYAQLKENLKAVLENEPPAKQRAVVWKTGRVRKSDGQLDDDVQEVVNEVENITQSLTTEELHSHGPNDVLSRVLPREYPGRVRTAGFGVTKKDFFNRTKASDNAEVLELKELVLQMGKQMQFMGSQIHVLNQGKQIENEVMAAPSAQVSPIGKSDQASNRTVLTDIPEGESQCHLFVESPAYFKVGSGTVFRVEEQRMHTALLKPDQVKVCISNIEPGCDDIRLPCPNVEGDIYTIKHAVGTYVAWPIKLVFLQKNASILNVTKEKSLAQSVTKAIPKKVTHYPREGDIDAHAAFLLCKSYAENSKRDESFTVAMSESFWGAAFEDHISFDCVREVVRREWLSASTICFYIRYLCDVYFNDMKSPKFSFISPHEDLEHTHIVDVLQSHEDQDHLIMIPYHSEHHWVLICINTKTESIYYMDPLRIHHTNEARVVMVQKINSAMTSYRGTKKRSISSKKKLNQHTWVSVECPKQDLVRGYCGFFVCLFMEDILDSGTTNLTLAYPLNQRCERFADHRISHVQHQWCGYLYNNFVKYVIL